MKKILIRIFWFRKPFCSILAVLSAVYACKLVLNHSRGAALIFGGGAIVAGLNAFVELDVQDLKRPAAEFFVKSEKRGAPPAFKLAMCISWVLICWGFIDLLSGN